LNTGPCQSSTRCQSGALKLPFYSPQEFENDESLLLLDISKAKNIPCHVEEFNWAVRKDGNSGE